MDPGGLGSGESGGVERRTVLRRWVGTVALLLSATYLITFPAMHRFHDGFFGAAEGDKYQFVWIFWWLKHSLLELGRAPFFTELLYHPTGVSLALHDMSYFWSLSSVPLQLFFSAATVLNLFLLISLPLNGLAFYRLALEVTRDHWGALAGSFVFAFCPYLVGRFRVSHVQYVGVFFIPLFLLCLWRYQRDPQPRHLLLAGVWLGLQTLISPYYGVGLGFVFAAFLIYRTLRSRSLWRMSGFWRSTLLHAAGTVAIAGLVTAPAVIPALSALATGDFEGRVGGTGYDYLEGSSADLVSYLLPDFTVAPWRGWFLTESIEQWALSLAKSLHGNLAEKAVYPGWVSWIAVLVALARPGLLRRVWPWLVLAGSFFVLTLGPTLFVHGEPYLEGWLPARLLQPLPIANIMRGTTRFATFVTLGTGMVLAGAISSLRRSRGPRMGMAVALTCMAISCLEFVPSAVRVSSRARWLSTFYDQMRVEDGEYAVLNVPADFRGARGGAELYVYAQTIHHRPIISGYVSREPRYVFETVERSEFLRAVQHRRYEEDRRHRLTNAALLDMPDTLRSLQVRYVIVHRALFTESEWERVNAWLQLGPLDPVHEDRWIRAYSVREVPPSASPIEP